jgi:hypothetical protein
MKPQIQVKKRAARRLEECADAPQPLTKGCRSGEQEFTSLLLHFRWTEQQLNGLLSVKSDLTPLCSFILDSRGK